MHLISIALLHTTNIAQAFVTQVLEPLQMEYVGTHVAHASLIASASFDLFFLRLPAIHATL